MQLSQYRILLLKRSQITHESVAKPSLLNMKLFFSLFLPFIAASAVAQLSQEIGDVPVAPVNYELEVLATELEHPSSIAFLPDGSYLIAERNAGLAIIQNGVKTVVDGMPDIHVRQQAGLLDVALHPDFEENNLIYFSYSDGSLLGSRTQLSRAELSVGDGNNAELSNLEVLFSQTPTSLSSLHYGGRLLFLPDQTLLLTLGEGYLYKDDAVKLDNLRGKVVRLNDDGSIPEDNPFVNTKGAEAEIFTYGHRNPQGLILLPDGKILSHEHGPRGGDEVNELRAGANYGWPEITYGIDYSGAIISELSEKDGMEQSIVHYVPSIAPSGFTQYNGEMFPEWQGDLFIGGLVSMQVRRIDVLENGKFGAQQKLFTELEARIRDVETGPDGALYFLTDASDGSLYRVTPRSTQN